MKCIYKMYLDCGRMGDLEGVFTEYKEIVVGATAANYEVYFGEVLGKHSEIVCDFNDINITEISDNESFVKLFEDNDLACGFNPFDYMGDEEEI